MYSAVILGIAVGLNEGAELIVDCCLLCAACLLSEVYATFVCCHHVVLGPTFSDLVSMLSVVPNLYMPKNVIHHPC